MNQLGDPPVWDTEKLPPSLTPREREVLSWLAHGKTDREVASLIGVSEKTIHHYAENIRIKLQVRNRTHAVTRALQLKLIRLDG